LCFALRKKRGFPCSHFSSPPMSASIPLPTFRRFLFAAAWSVVALVPAKPGRAAENADGLSGAPLAGRSGPAGTTLFTVLSPEQTGVKAFNAYDDPKMWWEHYREFTL